jgi:hypothetical protein
MCGWLFVFSAETSIPIKKDWCVHVFQMKLTIKHSWIASSYLKSV